MKKPLERQVLIDNNWFTAVVLHAYRTFNQAFYILEKDAGGGEGWIGFEGIRVVNPNDHTVTYGENALRRYKL